jgi:hypothetical protein
MITFLAGMIGIITAINAGTETVRLMYRLYLEGDGATGPLGVNETTKWLNSHRYRTRRGSTFGVGPVHKILTNTCYASGQWPYGKRNSRDGDQHDLSNVIYIPVPVLIEQATSAGCRQSWLGAIRRLHRRVSLTVPHCSRASRSVHPAVPE